MSYVVGEYLVGNHYYTMEGRLVKMVSSHYSGNAKVIEGDDGAERYNDLGLFQGRVSNSFRSKEDLCLIYHEDTPLLTVEETLVEALEACIEAEIYQANNGDCGYYDAEDCDHVIKARAAIALVKASK